MAPLWSGTSLLLPLSLCALLAVGKDLEFDIKSEGKNYLLTRLAFPEPGSLLVQATNFSGDDFGLDSRRPNRRLGLYLRKVIRNTQLPLIMDINSCNSYFIPFITNPSTTLKFGQDVMMNLVGPDPDYQDQFSIEFAGYYDLFFLDCKPEGNNAVGFHLKVSQRSLKNLDKVMKDGDPGLRSTATLYLKHNALLHDLATITTPRLGMSALPGQGLLWESRLFPVNNLMWPMSCTYQYSIGGKTGTSLNERHFTYLENLGSTTFQLDTILATVPFSYRVGHDIHVNNHFKFTIDVNPVFQSGHPTRAPTTVSPTMASTASSSPTTSPTTAPTAPGVTIHPSLAPTTSPTADLFPDVTDAPTAPSDPFPSAWKGFYVVGLSVEPQSIRRDEFEFADVCTDNEQDDCRCLWVGNENSTNPQLLSQLKTTPRASLLFSYEIEWRTSEKSWEEAMQEQDQASQKLAEEGKGFGIGYDPSQFHQLPANQLVQHKNMSNSSNLWEWELKASRDVTVTSFEPQAMAGHSTMVRVGPRLGLAYQSNELRLRSCFAFPTSYLKKLNATCHRVVQASVELTPATSIPSSELLLVSMDEKYVTPATTWDALDAALFKSTPLGNSRVSEGVNKLELAVPGDIVNLTSDFAMCVRTIAGNTYVFAYEGAHGSEPPVLKFTCGEPPTPPPYPGGGVAVEAEDRRVAIIILAVVAAFIFAIGVFLGARCCYKQRKQNFTYQDLANMAGVGGRVDGGDANGGIVMNVPRGDDPNAGHEEVGRVVARMREHLAAMEGTLQAKQGGGGGGGGSKRNGVAAGLAGGAGLAAGAGAVEMMHQGRKPSENFDDDEEEEASDDQEAEVEGGGVDEAEVEQYEREFRSVAIDDHDEDDGGASRDQSPQK